MCFIAWRYIHHVVQYEYRDIPYDWSGFKGRCDYFNRYIYLDLCFRVPWSQDVLIDTYVNGLSHDLWLDEGSDLLWQLKYVLIPCLYLCANEVESSKELKTIIKQLFCNYIFLKVPLRIWRRYLLKCLPHEQNVLGIPSNCTIYELSGRPSTDMAKNFKLLKK